MTVNWSKARSSVVGLPAIPQRASIVFDDPAIDRIDGAVQTPLARAKHIELHGRLVDGSALDHPVIETVVQIAGGSVQDVHPLLAQPFDADVRTMLTGLKDFSPKPWPQRFREMQAAGGHIEIVAVADCAGRPDRGCRRHARASPPMAGSMANCR